MAELISIPTRELPFLAMRKLAGAVNAGSGEVDPDNIAVIETIPATERAVPGHIHITYRSGDRRTLLLQPLKPSVPRQNQFLSLHAAFVAAVSDKEQRLVAAQVLPEESLVHVNPAAIVALNRSEAISEEAGPHLELFIEGAGRIAVGSHYLGAAKALGLKRALGQEFTNRMRNGLVPVPYRGQGGEANVLLLGPSSVNFVYGNNAANEVGIHFSGTKETVLLGVGDGEDRAVLATSIAREMDHLRGARSKGLSLYCREGMLERARLSEGALCLIFAAGAYGKSRPQGPSVLNLVFEDREYFEAARQILPALGIPGPVP